MSFIPESLKRLERFFKKRSPRMLYNTTNVSFIYIKTAKKLRYK